MHVLIATARAGFAAALADRLSDTGWGVTHRCHSSVDEISEALERVAFDAVVVDARLGRGDGLAVVEQVRAESPRTLRIVVANDAEHFAAPWRYACAHHCVAPRAAAVIEALDSSRALRTRLRTPTLDRLVEGVDAVFASLPFERALLGEAGARRGARALVDALGRNPVVAEVLCRRAETWGVHANASNDLEAALTRMGLSRTVSTAFAAEIYDAMERQTRVCPRWIAHERRSSWAVAEVASTIAPRGATAEYAHVAGLLLDLGRLWVAAQFPEAAEQVATSGATGRELCAVERDVLGADHAAIGARLLFDLDVPHPVVAAVAEHHEPATGGSSAHAAVRAVHVGVALVDAQAGHANTEDIDEEVVATLAPERLSSWRAVAKTQIDRRAA